eukprot:2844905-Amphidinium_carterae.1
MASMRNASIANAGIDDVEEQGLDTEMTSMRNILIDQRADAGIERQGLAHRMANAGMATQGLAQSRNDTHNDSIELWADAGIGSSNATIEQLEECRRTTLNQHGLEAPARPAPTQPPQEVQKRLVGKQPIRTVPREAMEYEIPRQVPIVAVHAWRFIHKKQKMQYFQCQVCERIAMNTQRARLDARGCPGQ